MNHQLPQSATMLKTKDMYCHRIEVEKMFLETILKCCLMYNESYCFRFPSWGPLVAKSQLWAEWHNDRKNNGVQILTWLFRNFSSPILKLHLVQKSLFFPWSPSVPMPKSYSEDMFLKILDIFVSCHTLPIFMTKLCSRASWELSRNAVLLNLKGMWCVMTKRWKVSIMVSQNEGAVVSRWLYTKGVWNAIQDFLRWILRGLKLVITTRDDDDERKENDGLFWLPFRMRKRERERGRND